MIINCKELRANIVSELKKNTYEGINAVFIQVGDNKASNTYVNNKIKLCKELGIEVAHIKIDTSITEKELITIIGLLNEDKRVTGIMVQLPLPKHIKEINIINAIAPEKDIDGFTNVNKGKLLNGDKSGIIPCTPKAIISIIESLNMNLEGKKVVIVGRSNIVGKPLAQLFINKGATVTICNSKTDKNVLRNSILYSDVFVSAIGQANYFDMDFFTKDSRVLTKEYIEYYLGRIIAIDVGINRDCEGKLCGDIDKGLYKTFEAVTPVPSGVGIITVLEVVRNLIECSKKMGV